MEWKRQRCWIGVLSRELEMLATNYAFDMHARFHRDEFPVSYSSERDYPELDEPLLPGKSANQKEVDRHASYFKFADDARTKLTSRCLLLENSVDSESAFEVRTDA